MVIVAAVDKSELDGAVLTEASSLSKAYDEPVHVVYVLKSDEFVNMEKKEIENKGQPAEREVIDEFVTNVASEISANLEVPAKPVGLVGNVSENILRYSNEKDARYIVISIRKRSPTGKAIFGSVSQSILLNADRPVVTVSQKEV